MEEDTGMTAGGLVFCNVLEYNIREGFDVAFREDDHIAVLKLLRVIVLLSAADSCARYIFFFYKQKTAYDM